MRNKPFLDEVRTDSRPTDPPPLRRELLELAAVAVAYWLAVRLGLSLVSRPEGIASVWPASGVALAVLLIRPKNRWAPPLAVIFCVNALGNVAGGNSLPISLGYALANALEQFGGAWILTKCCGARIAFERSLEIAILFAAAALVNACTALLGATVSTLAFHGSFAKSWLLWWASDGLGIILVAPAIASLAAIRIAAPRILPRRAAEAAAMFLALSSLLWFMFGPFTVAERPLLRPYFLYPILLWMAFRLSIRGMSAALVLISSFAILGTLSGYGFFHLQAQTQTERLVSVQVFLVITCFFALLLNALVAERRRMERLLRESQMRTLQAERLGLAGSWVYAIEADSVIGSPEALLLFGFPPDAGELPLGEVEERIPERERVHRALVDLIEEDLDYDLEYSIDPADGSAPRIVHSIAAVEKDGQGKAVKALGFLQDITALKKSEEALQASAKENRQLLLELQHRVKNSFNMISSLIFVTSKGSISPDVSAALAELELRIRSVAELYSLLYSSGSIHELRLDEYCGRIASTILGMSGNISLTTEMDALSVSAKRAAPIGLILTELLTNAVKYAFPGGRKGAITIALRGGPAGARLEVRDSGVGLPAGFAPAASAGMGMRLVLGLTEQLGGSYSMTGDANGTACALSFSTEEDR